MTDEFYFVLMHHTIVQILEAAGFDSSHTDSIRILTDISIKHVELLARTVSAYSCLAGRSIGNMYDVLNALNELVIDISVLKEWLDQESQFSMLSWTELGDSSHAIQDIVERNLQSPVEYSFGKSQPCIQDERERQIEKNQEKCREERLPDYVPFYLPPFPALTDNVPLMAVPQIKPWPKAVKKKLKSVDNPFTHLEPFEDDMLSTAEQGWTNTLSFALSPSELTQTLPQKRQYTTVFPRLKSHLCIIHDIFVLNEFTKQNAAPSNMMFAQEPGLLSSILVEKVPSLTLSKLTTPNLAADIVLSSQPSHSKDYTTGGHTIDETESIFDVPIEPLPLFTKTKRKMSKNKPQKISFIMKKPSYSQCICNRPNVDDGRPMIACHSCGIYFHTLCVDIDTDKEQWACSRCS